MHTKGNFIKLAEEYRRFINEEMNNEEVVNRLYDKYNGLLDKEKIYIMYRAYKTTYINVKESKRLLENNLDEVYKRIVYERGTCRLIHIGRKDIVNKEKE